MRVDKCRDVELRLPVAALADRPEALAGAQLTDDVDAGLGHSQLLHREREGRGLTPAGQLPEACILGTLAPPRTAERLRCRDFSRPKRRATARL